MTAPEAEKPNLIEPLDPARHDRADFSCGVAQVDNFFRRTADKLAKADLVRTFVMVGVGRHHREKRWPMVIDAVSRAGARAPVGLVLLGQGMTTRALESRVGESPHIRLFRPVYDRHRLARIMASADAFIHGSSAEPFGLVAYEALASGLPMIVPDEGGAFEASAPAYAETYRAGDAHACADAIARLVGRDRATLRTAAAATPVRSDEEHAAALAAHYEEIIARRRLAA